jgi:hypothetical protein
VPDSDQLQNYRILIGHKIGGDHSPGIFDFVKQIITHGHERLHSEQCRYYVESC